MLTVTSPKAQATGNGRNRKHISDNAHIRHEVAPPVPWRYGGGVGGGHEATDTWLPNAPVSQATGHCHAKFNQFLVLCINHDWNVPLCTCSQVCSAYETPIL